MSTTDIETQRIAFTPRTLISMFAAVIVIVSGYFVASERVNQHIDETNKRIDNVMMLYQSQENLIMSYRFRDSMEIDYLRQQLKK
jgi:hypothetical protein